MKATRHNNLICKLAWSFHHTTGIEFEELKSEATLAYWEARHSFNPERGVKLITWAYTLIKNRLVTFCKQERRMITMDEFPEYLQPGFTPKYLHDFDVDMLFTGDAREVVELVLEGNLNLNQAPKLVRGALSRTLFSKGWTQTQVWNSIREVKSVINCN